MLNISTVNINYDIRKETLTTWVQEFRSYRNSENLTLKSLAYDGFNSIKHKKEQLQNATYLRNTDNVY